MKPETPARKQQDNIVLFQYHNQDDQDDDESDNGHQTPVVSRLAPEPIQSPPSAIQAVLMALYIVVHPV